MITKSAVRHQGEQIRTLRAIVHRKLRGVSEDWKTDGSALRAAIEEASKVAAKKAQKRQNDLLVAAVSQNEKTIAMLRKLLSSRV